MGPIATLPAPAGQLSQKGPDPFELAIASIISTALAPLQHSTTISLLITSQVLPPAESVPNVT